MARPLYSSLLAQALSVPDSPQALGAPISGQLWVIREVVCTFGSFAAYIRGAIQVGSGEPGLWLCGNPPGVYVGLAKFSSTWEGRIVVPSGITLYAYASSGDAMDISVSGYVLSD